MRVRACVHAHECMSGGVYACGISGNSTQSLGGAIRVFQGSASITRTLFEDNGGIPLNVALLHNMPIYYILEAGYQALCTRLEGRPLHIALMPKIDTFTL